MMNGDAQLNGKLTLALSGKSIGPIQNLVKF